MLGGLYLVFTRAKNSPSKFENGVTKQSKLDSVTQDEETNEHSDTNLNSGQASQQISSQDEKKYLVIEEWGLKFELPKQFLGDITYKINNQAEINFGGPVKVDIFSDRITQTNFKGCYTDNTSTGAAFSFYAQQKGMAINQPETVLTYIDELEYIDSSSDCIETLKVKNVVEDLEYINQLREIISNTLTKI